MSFSTEPGHSHPPITTFNNTNIATIADQSGCAFDYQPLHLNSSSHQFRLLRTISSSSNEIKCSMQIVNLATKPVYKALSYTWGPPIPTAEITVNGKPMEIREKLYQFLATWKESIDFPL